TVIPHGLIPAAGTWYSSHLNFRRQTQAMLEGRTAISNRPSDMFWDAAWSNGSVQQVWGLGVPLWRLLFETLARSLGQTGFPDRLAFALALFSVAAAAIHIQFK